MSARRRRGGCGEEPCEHDSSAGKEHQTNREDSMRVREGNRCWARSSSSCSLRRQKWAGPEAAPRNVNHDEWLRLEEQLWVGWWRDGHGWDVLAQRRVQVEASIFQAWEEAFWEGLDEPQRPKKPSDVKCRSILNGAPSTVAPQLPSNKRTEIDLSRAPL